jgi:hypothetical protein
VVALEPFPELLSAGECQKVSHFHHYLIPNFLGSLLTTRSYE